MKELPHHERVYEPTLGHYLSETAEVNKWVVQTEHNDHHCFVITMQLGGGGDFFETKVTNYHLQL